MMKRFGSGFVLTFIIAGLLTMFGCEHAPVKPTEDSKRLYQIDIVIESLRQAYENRNLQSFSAAYPQGHPEDLQLISSLLESMDHPQLSLTIDRIVLQGDAAQVSLHWELNWKSETKGPVKQRGNAVFQLTGKSELRLQAIEGDNPFTAPGLLKAS